MTSFGCWPYFEYKGRGQHFHCYAKRQVMVMLLSVKLFFVIQKKNLVLLALHAVYCCGHKWVVIGLLIISFKCVFFSRVE